MKRVGVLSFQGGNGGSGDICRPGSGEPLPRLCLGTSATLRM